jgi:SAM-dependent methyltransferase
MHSTEPSVPGPFDDGDLYDLLCAGIEYGIDYYVALAREANGPVLDIACGTGRIMLPCLRLSLDVEGVDLYDGMLDRLRRKAAAEGFAPPLHRADMSDFRLSRRFALIMIPFNAFIHNMTADAQLACLRLCREHLLPGGLFVFDTFFPGREYINLPDGTRVLEGEIPHPETGLPVRMYDTRSFDRVEQIQRSRNEVEFLDAAGNVTATYPSEFSTRFFYKCEMELLLRLSGFAHWRIYGGFDRHPLANETDQMIVEAWDGGRTPAAHAT